MVVPELRSVQEQTSAAIYFLSRNHWVTSSMTAIVRSLTREGFVMAADGQSSGAIDGAMLTDSVQKIFPVKTPHGAFAYSIVGTVELITGDGTEVAVNLVDEIQSSASLLAHRKTKTLTGYAVRLFRPVCKAMEDALKSAASPAIHRMKLTARWSAGIRSSGFTLMVFRTGILFP
jgi:hypothetical protein